MRSLKALLILVVLLATLPIVSFTQVPYGLGYSAKVYMGTVASGVTDTTDITVMPAVASTYNWPTMIKIVNTSSTGTYGYVCNGTCATAANRVDYFFAPPGASYSNVVPFRSKTNTAVCVAAASGVTTLYASARGYTEAY
jgi:hypothetical protein